MARKRRVPGQHALSKYKEEFAEQARKLCLLGATDKEIADFFGKSVMTIRDWMDDFPEFGEAIRSGKMMADANVADRLYNRAMGYSHYDTDIRTCKGNLVKTQVIRHYPPDTRAAEFWLSCRQKQRWTQAKQLSGPGGGPIEITDPAKKKDDKEIARRIAFYLTQAAEDSENADDKKGQDD